MKIVWDQSKRAANLELRGLDFAMVTLPFFETAQILPAKKDRFLAVGLIGDRPYAVVFKPLGTQALSSISLRLGSLQERTLL